MSPFSISSSALFFSLLQSQSLTIDCTSFFCCNLFHIAIIGLKSDPLHFGWTLVEGSWDPSACSHLLTDLQVSSVTHSQACAVGVERCCALWWHGSHKAISFFSPFLHSHHIRSPSCSLEVKVISSGKKTKQKCWVGHLGTIDVADCHLLCISPCWWKCFQCLQGIVFPWWW